MAKLSSGTADNLPLAVYLSAKCPVFFAPAMDLDMYRHPSTNNSFDQLKEYGNIMIPAGTGELASGLHGEGRMAEPEDIMQFLEEHFSAQLPLKDKTILITAGPTYEAIDPVRFIGNHSSGKMGFALAETAAALGANVILVSGPTHLEISEPNLKLIRVVSNEEMYAEVNKYFAEADVVIAAAAVSDYKPKQVALQKIKKNDNNLTLELEKTRDILGTLGENKKDQMLIGFALETNDELENARGKLKRKNLDFIVLNSLQDKGAGFQKDTNKITIVYPDSVKEFDLKPKSEVAKDILNEIVTLINA